MDKCFAWIGSRATEGQREECVKKGLSTHYGTTKAR
jgi:hypothetical protein